MDVIKVLRELYEYYHGNRGVGSTTLMKRGTANYEYPKLVLAVDHGQRKHLGLQRNEIVTPGTLDILKGSDLPLAIDNYTLREIFQQTFIKLAEQEDRTKKAEIEVWGERFNKELLQDEIKNMKAHPFRTLYRSLWRH